MSPTHRIDLNIDRERAKVVNDLSAGNCLAGTMNVERGAEMGSRLRQSERAITDGALIAAPLQACQAAAAADRPRLAKPKHNVFAVGLRRVVLETRYYLLRANAYHFAYQSVRWISPRLQGKGKNEEYAMALK